MFRRSNRMTELIDEFGNRTCKVQEGRMNIASHDSVFQALEYRANRLKGERKLHGVDDRTLLGFLTRQAPSTPLKYYLSKKHVKEVD